MKLARLIINICEEILKEQHEDSYMYSVTFRDNPKAELVKVAPGLRGEEATNAIEKSSQRQVVRMELYGEYKNGVFKKAVGGEIR